MKTLNHRARERMKPEIVIREEGEADTNAIAEVTVAAFKTLAISNHTEQFIVEALPEEVFLALVLDGPIPQGMVEFHEGFKADGHRRVSEPNASRQG